MTRALFDLAGEEAVHQILAALSDDDVPEPRQICAEFVQRESTAAPAR